MSAVIAIALMLTIVAGLIGFSVINALRIKRHLNKSIHAFRTRLEDEANSVLEALLDRPDEGPPRDANGSSAAAK
jgi:hypothetical protein